MSDSSRETPALGLTIGMELARPTPVPTVSGRPAIKEPESQVKKRATELLKRGWSMAKVARYIGVRPRTIARWRDADRR